MTQRRSGGWSRRSFLRCGLDLAALGFAGGGPAVLSAAAWASERSGIEKPRLRIGFIPLTDCAPIVMAQELGYFRRHGLDVTLSKEASWANIRDKVSVGVLDGAHMLGPMPLAATLGIGALRKPTITACSLDLNGNAITVSEKLFARMRKADPEAVRARPMTATALRKVIEEDRRAGRKPMTFAMVFPVSTHNYQIRYWMASAGIDPDRDIRLIVIPPPQMVVNLETGNIDGYCVGEPWNERAVKLGIGRTVITSYELWNNNPEKVFGVDAEWAERYPNTHRAIIRALIEAGRYIDEPSHRAHVARVISQPQYVNAPYDVVEMSMVGAYQYAPHAAPVRMPDFNVFYRYAAGFPWRSRAEWFLSQMIRWGQVRRPIDVRQVASAVYRPDLYREAARELGIPYPTIDYRSEGVHASPWVLTQASAPILMGPDLFFDHVQFHPREIAQYIDQFRVRHVKLTPAQLVRSTNHG
ncbi:MAG: CmpA/NrtA family ABC transporter substrate-binding protein [Acidiferrobacteraceae bacterium]